MSLKVVAETALETGPSGSCRLTERLLALTQRQMVPTAASLQYVLTQTSAGPEPGQTGTKAGLIRAAASPQRSTADRAQRQ